MDTARAAGGCVKRCKLWPNALSTGGYGVTWIDGHWASAHRVAYAEHVGPLEEGKQVHHLCGNRSCVEPTHLVQLTPKEHAAAHGPMKAEIARRNGAKKCKLSLDQADEMRRRYAAGEKQSALGLEFGLCKASVSELLNGRSYVRAA